MEENRFNDMDKLGSMPERIEMTHEKYAASVTVSERMLMEKGILEYNEYVDQMKDQLIMTVIAHLAKIAKKEQEVIFTVMKNIPDRKIDYLRIALPWLQWVIGKPVYRVEAERVEKTVIIQTMVEVPKCLFDRGRTLYYIKEAGEKWK